MLSRWMRASWCVLWFQVAAWLSLIVWDVGYRMDESTGALLYTFPGQQNGLRLLMLVSSFNFQLPT